MFCNISSGKLTGKMSFEGIADVATVLIIAVALPYFAYDFYKRAKRDAAINDEFQRRAERQARAEQELRRYNEKYFREGSLLRRTVLSELESIARGQKHRLDVQAREAAI